MPKKIATPLNKSEISNTPSPAPSSISTNLFGSESDTKTPSAKDPVIVINGEQKKEKKEKPKMKDLRRKIKSKFNFEATEEQKLRMFRNYIVPKLEEYNVENPNNDLLKSIKEAFGKDNKEKLNEPLPTFSYENDAVRQKMASDLFDTETRLISNKKAQNETIGQEFLKTKLPEKSAKIIQRRVKPFLIDKQLNQLEQDIKQTENVVYGANKEYNIKHGDELRASKKKEVAKIQSVQKSSKPDEEKQRISKVANENIKRLNAIIIPKRNPKVKKP
jgi:hypothetical protein